MADEPGIEDAATDLRGHGGTADAVQADLGTQNGIDRLWEAARECQVDYLLVNAGIGIGGALVE